MQRFSSQLSSGFRGVPRARAAMPAASLTSRSAVAARRGYATEAPASGSSSTVPLAIGAAVAAGAGYYFFAGGAAAPAKPAAPLKSALDKEKFIEFPLKSKSSYNHNTIKLTFDLPDGTATLLPTAGLVLVQAPENGPKDKKGNPAMRPYTPISSADRPGEVEFLIKKYDTGLLTPFLHDLKPGDKVGIKGPIPKFPYKANEFEQVVMLAGGSGITPMYQVLDHALKLKDDKTKFTLIFSNVSPADVLLKDEFDALKKAHPDRFQPVFVVDKPDDSWKGETGYISADLIKKYVSSPAEKIKFFVCGPPGQVKALSGAKDGGKQGAVGGALKELGYTEEQVFKF